MRSNFRKDSMATKNSKKLTLLPKAIIPRNTGIDLDLDWVSSIQANTSAIERRAATIASRRSIKKATSSCLVDTSSKMYGPYNFKW